MTALFIFLVFPQNIMATFGEMLHNARPKDYFVKNEMEKFLKDLS